MSKLSKTRHIENDPDFKRLLAKAKAYDEMERLLVLNMKHTEMYQDLRAIYGLDPVLETFAMLTYEYGAGFLGPKK